MPLITPVSLERALGFLGEVMAARDHQAHHFVVVGGSSLLALGLVSRRDQILLRLHAAGGRHLQDLLELKPTAGELLDAARWTRTQDPSEGFRLLLDNMLKFLGHADLIEKF